MHDYQTITTSIPFNDQVGIECKQSRNPGQSFETFLSKCNGIKLFTDGSKMQSCVGASCVAPDNDIRICRKVHSNSSIFTAECIALNDALDICLSNVTLDYFIFTDSRSALEALNSTRSNVKTNPYILEIKRKYNLHRENVHGTTISFFWVPSHVDIRGNELADQSAKNSALRTKVDLDRIPFTDFVEKFKRDAKTSTVETISDPNSSTGRIYFDRFYLQGTKPWFHGRKFKRDFVVTINRLRSNHYNLASSLARMKIIECSSCKCGHDQEDIDHVLWHCPLYADHRPELLKNLSKLGFKAPWKTELLISTPHLNSCLRMHEFLRKCNLFV